MINKEQLLDQLQKFDYFVVNNLVDLQSQSKRGIMQTSVYNKVNLHWNGTVFKFWNDKCEDATLFLDANIQRAGFEKDVLLVHIVDCPEPIKIRCCKRIH